MNREDRILAALGLPLRRQWHGALSELLRPGQAWTEHRLLRRLHHDGLLADGYAGDSLSLFRNHFSLFHALYTLRDQWLAEGRGALQVSPLCIRLDPLHDPGRQRAIDRHDALRDYYLDLGRLDLTTAGDVHAMLSGFWKRVARDDARTKALRALGLRDPVDDAAIKRRYRALVMRHHPDRGGDKAAFQAINEALRALL